jgi:hypothetical protein
MGGRAIKLKRLMHGPSIHKDANLQMSSLLVFNRVYRLELQSVVLVFSTPLVNYRSAPLTFSLVHLPPHPLSLCEKYRGTCIQFIRCVTAYWGWGGGAAGASDKHLPPSTFTGQFLRKAYI